MLRCMRKNIKNYNNKGFHLTGNQWFDNSVDDRYNRLRDEAYQAGIGCSYDTIQYTNNLIGDYGTKLKALSYLKFK